MVTTRPARKAGSWYESDAEKLRTELTNYLAAVPESLDGASLPIAGARIIIAPHAGYKFSGPCAAWAYKTLDLSRAKRVFVLGPSHVYNFDGCAASTFDKWETPFGELAVDRALAKEFENAASMALMPPEEEIEEHSLEMQEKEIEEHSLEMQEKEIEEHSLEMQEKEIEEHSLEMQEKEIEEHSLEMQEKEIEEHSLEMHMPYLYLRCQQAFGSPDKFPKIVPVVVGFNNGPEEKKLGRALLPYLKDPENAFIISSDFCHWGPNYHYMVYSPTSSPGDLVKLRKWDRAPAGPPIHETIRAIDEAAMDAVKSGSHDAFLATLRQTGNTVCGQHPIGIMMAALELLGQEPQYQGKGRFNVIQYRRSNLVQQPNDYSVSYVSAYAVL